MKRQIRSIAGLSFAIFVSVMVAGCLATPPVSEVSHESQELPPYGVITTQQAAFVVVTLQDDPRFVILDIRTSAEVEAGHLPGATTLDYYSDTFRDDLASLDRENIYLIYCRTGNRTGQAYQIMHELGFESVFDMGGGISQWINADFPICQGTLAAEHTCSGQLPVI